MASLAIESVPAGAEVIGPDRKSLGKTPLHLEWPVSKDSVVFELRASGFKKKTKQLVVSGNTAVHVELERVQVQQTGHVGQTGKATGSGGARHDNNGLMKPDD